MRRFACVLFALAAGCTSLQQEARVRREAESVVWTAMSAPDARVRAHATRVTADVADPTLDRGLGARLGDPSPAVRATPS